MNFYFILRNKIRNNYSHIYPHIMSNPESILIKARESKRLTQSELGEAAGVGLRQIQNYEKGKFPKYKADTIKVIDKVLETNIYEIIYENKSEKEVLRLSNEATPVGAEIGEYATKTNSFIELSSGLYLMKTKLVNKKARAGYITGWGDDEFIEDLPEFAIQVAKPHAGTYMSFEIEGNSMDYDGKDAIEAGDIVTGRLVSRSHWSNKLHLHKYQDFVIVTYDGILVKRIINHDTKTNIITCHSLNTDKKEYPDFELELNKVMQIFNIVRVSKERGL